MAVESANSVSLLLIEAAYTPVMAALLMAVANPATDNAVPPEPTVTKVPLMYMLKPTVNAPDTELVPCTVGQDDFQSSLPTCTQVLYKLLRYVLEVSALVGPPRL